MPGKRSLEETLAGLRRLREEPGSETSLGELRRVLGREVSLAVGRAAAIAGEFTLTTLVPDLVSAFGRFFDDPAKDDPGCKAKTAIVEALRRLDYDDVDLYRRGARHMQMEPVWRGRVDAAVDLRAASALGLAEHGGSDVLADLADLLADSEAPVRVAAAHAVSVHGREAGVPLLRLKALSGDAEPRVVTECLLAVLRLDARRSLPFVASFLEKGDGPAEAAAAALGESRLEEALPVLQGWIERASRRGLRRAALLAIAALRREEAWEALLSMVRGGPVPAARDALEALASLGRDHALYDRAKEAAQSRRDLGDAFARAFGHRA